MTQVARTGFPKAMAVVLATLATPGLAAQRMVDCQVAQYSGTKGAAYVARSLIQLDYYTGRGAVPVRDRHVESQFGGPVPGRVVKTSRSGVEVTWQMLKAVKRSPSSHGYLVRVTLNEAINRSVVLIDYAGEGFERGEGSCTARAKPLG